MRFKSAVFAAAAALTLLWHSATIAKPVPTRKIELTEQQLKIVQSRISLPIEGLKYRVIRAHETLRDLRLFLNLETEYYEQHTKYRRYFGIRCYWETPASTESLTCAKPSYIVELIGEGSGQKIDLGNVGDGLPVSIDEVFEVVAFFRSHPTYGKGSPPLSAFLTGLRVAPNGYKVRHGNESCNGSIDVLRRRDGSLSIDKVFPEVCI